MKELYELGISTNTIISMVEICPTLKTITKEEIEVKIDILKKIRCSRYQIINIISSNPMFLKKTVQKITNLINMLNNLRFTALNILFDANPYIFNVDINELTDYINNRVDDGESLEEIVDDLDSMPYLFNTI